MSISVLLYYMRCVFSAYNGNLTNTLTNLVLTLINLLMRDVSIGNALYISTSQGLDLYVLLN